MASEIPINTVEYGDVFGSSSAECRSDGSWLAVAPAVCMVIGYQYNILSRLLDDTGTSDSAVRYTCCVPNVVDHRGLFQLSRRRLLRLLAGCAIPVGRARR